MNNRAALERLLERGMDNSLLRLGLGQACLEAGEAALAAAHLQRCVELDPLYSAGWKQLGKALLATGDSLAAERAWNQGLRVTAEKGDKQAEKEMRVFLRRLARPV